MLTSQWQRTLVLLFALALSTTSQIQAQPWSYPTQWPSLLKGSSPATSAPASIYNTTLSASDDTIASPPAAKAKVMRHPPTRQNIEDIMRRNASLGAPLETPDFLKRRDDSPTVVILTLGTRGKSLGPTATRLFFLLTLP